MSGTEQGWPQNYFNYYTEIEEHFQLARGTGLFLLSPLDWALIETWHTAGVPLEAVLRGIDAAFEKWRSKKSRTQMVNSLAFCSQAVLTEAEALSGVAGSQPKKETAAPFSAEELGRYLAANADRLAQAGHGDLADTLHKLAGEAEQHLPDLEQLEQRLTALEEKLMARLTSAQTEDALFAARRELDLQLRPHRGKMSAAQIAMLEKQYLERRLLEQVNLPRLSLFYMR